MLYGHIETVRERLEHMAALRELQDTDGRASSALSLLRFSRRITNLAIFRRQPGWTT